MKIKNEKFNRIIIIEDGNKNYFRVILSNYFIILRLKLIFLFIIYSLRIYIFIELINNLKQTQKNKRKAINITDKNNF